MPTTAACCQRFVIEINGAVGAPPNGVPTTASRCQRFVIELYLQLGAPPNGVPITASQRQRFVIELEQPKLHLMMYQLLLLAVKGLLLSYSCRSSP